MFGFRKSKTQFVPRKAKPGEVENTIADIKRISREIDIKLGKIKPNQTS